MTEIETQLLAAFRDAREKLGDDPSLLEATLSLIIIQDLAGNHSYNEVVDGAAPYGLIESDDPEEKKLIKYFIRMYLADALFRMRNISALARIQARLNANSINFRQVFFEARAVAIALEAEFDVDVTNETGILGRDFDFTISSEAGSCAVEVTELSTCAYEVSSIRNRLRKKARQLPEIGPGHLIVTIPTSWASDGERFERVFPEAIQQLFGYTQRVNAVTVQFIQPYPTNNGGAVWIEFSREFQHPAPRTAGIILNRISRNVDIIEISQNSEDQDRFRSEYYRWAISFDSQKEP